MSIPRHIVEMVLELPEQLIDFLLEQEEYNLRKLLVSVLAVDDGGGFARFFYVVRAETSKCLCEGSDAANIWKRRPNRLKSPIQSAERRPVQWSNRVSSGRLTSNIDYIIIYFTTFYKRKEHNTFSLLAYRWITILKVLF